MCNNKCADKKVPRVQVGDKYLDPTTGKVHDEDNNADIVEHSAIDDVRKQIGVKLDGAVECVMSVVRKERVQRLNKCSGRKRNGWSAKYAKVIADVNELVAIADEGCGATPVKLRELLDRIEKLNEVHDINIDCSGMSQDRVSKTIKSAAKRFLSTMHGTTRNKLRRGAAILQKSGAAVVQGISLRAQKRTKHELLKHERNMEKIRLAGKMRKYINSSLRRNEAIGLYPRVSVNTPVLG